MADLLAWTATDGESHALVYAEDVPGARHQATRDGLDFWDSEVRRAPELDAYTPGPPPADVLHAKGWLLPCADRECDHLVGGQECDDCQHPENGSDRPEPVTLGALCFCGPECFGLWLSRRNAAPEDVARWESEGGRT